MNQTTEKAGAVPAREPGTIKVMNVDDLDCGATHGGLRSSGPEANYWLAKQVDKFGLLSPPVLNLDTGRLVGGARVVAYLRSRGDKTVPVWCVHLSEPEERAAGLALNCHAGEWVWEKVAAELEAVQESGLDVVFGHYAA